LTKTIIKGLDNGNNYTKDNELRIFKSAYSRINSNLSNDNKITINGVDYWYGQGNIVVDIDKFDSDINRVCTWANLAQSEDCEVLLVVGLPISQYETNKEKYYNTAMNYNNDEVVYKNKLVRTKIKDVTVFAQGAGVLFNYKIPDGLYIIFDVGSYTINAVLVELVNGMPKIIKFNTWYDGILTFYESVVNNLNKIDGITLDFSDVEMIIKYGYSVKGDKRNDELINLMEKEYLDNILTKLKLNYKSYATTPILLCGGGGELLQKMFEGYLNNAILMPDSQFANAIGYYNFGLQKYGERS
jgi:plasmid segregation protein ParM